MAPRVIPVFFAFPLLLAAQSLTLDLTTVPTSITPQSLVVGDFNHDGKPDLAVTGSEGAVQILIGNGDGTFHAGQTTTTAAPATQVVEADFNGDGNPDLAVMVGSSGQVVVLLGSANGTFQAPIATAAQAPTGNFTPGNNPQLMAGDVNGDGIVDLIVGPYSMASSSISVASSSTMYVLLGRGDGTFQSPVASSITPVSYSTGTAVDFYGNGKTEILLVGIHPSYPNSSLLTGAANGTLTETPVSSISGTGGEFSPLAVGKLTNSGKPDVIVAQSCTTIPSAVSVLLSGSLTPVNSMVADVCTFAPGSTPGFTQAAAADMNGDGIPDLLLSNGSGLLYVFLGKGDGTFSTTAAGTFYTTASASFQPTTGFDIYGSLTTADFRGTGRQDVVMAISGKSVVLLENGSGTPPQFQPAGVVSSATLTAQPAVAGSLISIFGANLAYQTGVGLQYPNVLPNWLFGTSVTLNGTEVPILWLSPTQANVQIPWEDSGLAQATLMVTRNELAAQPATIQLAPAAPGLFTMNGEGTGQAAAQIAGTSTIAAPAGAFSGSRPAHPGEYVSLYATGLGAVVQPVQLVTGEGTPANQGPFLPFTPAYFTTVQTATVSIGGVPAIVQFAGLAPYMIGVYQINVLIPANAPVGGAIPVQLSIGGVSAPVATIAIGPS